MRRACAMTLCNLSTAEQNIGALAKAGALKALLVISCVKSNDPETRRICMKAVMNLLRLPANVPLLCQDGLLWAFGLFTSAMESKDYDILCDAFLALAFYPATRKGVAKPQILHAMFQVLDLSAASMTAKVKLLKGLSNVLCDLPHAAQLIHVGVLSHLIAIVAVVNHAAAAETHDHAEGEASMLVAQILVLIFQSCPDAESDFAQPEMLRAVERLLHTDHDDCGRRCAILLYQMSLHATTRDSLLDGLPDHQRQLVVIVLFLGRCAAVSLREGYARDACASRACAVQRIVCAQTQLDVECDRHGAVSACCRAQEDGSSGDRRRVALRWAVAQLIV